MEEEADAGDELLSLGLALGTIKKRKKACSAQDLLRARERMLQAVAERHAVLENTGGDDEQLIRLLLVAASAVEADHTHAATRAALIELYRHASPRGDPIQRVVAYFADALVAAILPENTAVAPEPTPEQEFAAFTQLYRASPYYQLAHFTANQTIIEAFEAEEHRNGRRLHVIDFDVCYGFQWPSLIQSLSDKASPASPISLRLTGLGRSVKELKETETRLVNFSKGCGNLTFAFNGVLRSTTASDLNVDKKATLAVNLVFHLQTLHSSSEVLATLKSVHVLSPSVVLLAEREGVRANASFLDRFVENMNYFSAMFHSLHDCLPAESAERLSIERNHLGKEIRVAVSGTNLGNTDKDWSETERMRSVGFRELKLSSRSVSQAKLLLKIKGQSSSIMGGSGFGITETDDGRRISLCWQERNLVTVSAWRCAR